MEKQYPKAPEAYDIQKVGSGNSVAQSAQIFAERVTFGSNITLGEGVILVADEITIGDNVTIGRNSDIRASTIYLGQHTEVHRSVRILVAETFRIGAAARIAEDVRIVCRDFVAGNQLYLGDNVAVGYGGTMTSTATLAIGGRVTIGQHTILNANCPIRIDDNVGTGSYLAIWTHGYHFGHGPLDGYKPAYFPVHICRNVWLGFHVTVLPGVTIGENSIIAAGAVVAGDVPANVLAGGVPAKIRKNLSMMPVDGTTAHESVSRILELWCNELRWKGCQIVSSFLDQIRSEVTVSLADGGGLTRVVLLGASDPMPVPCAGEVLSVIALESRSEFASIDTTSTCVFDLRAGQRRGCTSPIVEDLRDQLRRHAMPCGDDSCFSSIEPLPFARLRTAVYRQPEIAEKELGNSDK